MTTNYQYQHRLPARNRERLCCVALLIIAAFFQPAAFAQPKPKVVRVFLDVRETNFDKPSTAAINTLSERLNSSGFRVTTNRREAAVILEGSLSSRSTPVTDDVKKEGGVNAEASASLRLLVGSDVISTSVQRSSPGDWGVQQDRVGEDRLIEVAGRVADDLIADDFIQEILKLGATASTTAGPVEKPSPARPQTARKPSGPKRGVSFLEVVSLMQKYVPEDRVAEAVRKYGIKFKPRESALAQLRSLGASETLINAIKSSNVNS